MKERRKAWRQGTWRHNLELIHHGNTFSQSAIGLSWTHNPLAVSQKRFLWDFFFVCEAATYLKFDDSCRFTIIIFLMLPGQCQSNMFELFRPTNHKTSKVSRSFKFWCIISTTTIWKWSNNSFLQFEILLFISVSLISVGFKCHNALLWQISSAVEQMWLM